jgi:predicted MPP superfamily phosphohydrolase
MQSPWKIEIGSFAPPEVREEQVCLPRIDRPFRVLFMSDLHLVERKTERLIEQLKRIIATTDPNLLLLGGDLVDRKSGLPQLGDLVSCARRQCLVGAIGGNHDRRVGIELVDRAVEHAGGVWLDRRPLAFSIGATRIVASGAAGGQTSPSEVSIRCMHYPNSFALSGSPEHNLVFAGHLHGCQMTAFSWRGRSYPGAWFYRWNGPRFARRNSVMLVSRGLRDAVPVRVNCPREVVLCHCIHR